jgi:hypothetical protein
LFLVIPVLLISACNKDDDQKKQSGTFYGPTGPLGQGTVRSFVILNAAGKPEIIGMKFSASALTGLPIDATKEWEYPFELPKEALSTGFDHLAIDWNPQGHDPKPIYGLPHLDFHFYTITKEEQAKVIPGPDTVSVPKNYIPQDYTSGVIAIPDMGVHWSDSKAPEFTGQQFTDTFVYGFYHGRLTFLEPMATTAWLQTRPDFKINIKQPQYFQKAGYYPSVSHISYDANANEYTLALEGLKWADAN